MMARGLIDRGRAREYFDRMELRLYRFPAIDSGTFRCAVDDAFGE
jgi:hypothetical protein